MGLTFLGVSRNEGRKGRRMSNAAMPERQVLPYLLISKGRSDRHTLRSGSLALNSLCSYWLHEASKSLTFQSLTVLASKTRLKNHLQRHFEDTAIKQTS